MSADVTSAVNVPKVGSGLVFPYANRTLASLRVWHWTFCFLSHFHVSFLSPTRTTEKPFSIFSAQRYEIESGSPLTSKGCTTNISTATGVETLLLLAALVESPVSLEPPRNTTNYATTI